MATRVLLINSQEEVWARVQDSLGPSFQVDGQRSGGEGVAALEKAAYDLVICGIAMIDLPGVDFIKLLRHRDPDLPVLVYTKHASLKSAVEAMRAGAYDYLESSADKDTLRVVCGRAIEHGSLAREVRRLRHEIDIARGTQQIVGDSPPMKELFALVERVADSEASVLILGESGTGKELLARTIHRQSPRKDGPFIAFDCSALAPSLLESELFGHEKGAFTGAGRARRGLFREAQGGTLFLDEIGDIAAEVQNKLLRVLQEREVKPVGSDSFTKVNARVVAATNKNLRQMVKDGSFREDLYFRIAVVPVEVPPLRERKEDIPLIAAHILARRKNAIAPAISQSERRWPTRVSSNAIAKLMAYAWPGNIRELENVLSRAAILCRSDEIHSEDLPELESPSEFSASIAQKHQLSGVVPLKQVLKEATRAVEREAIRHALREVGGSPTSAAKLLQISRASLYNKMKEHDIRH